MENETAARQPNLQVLHLSAKSLTRVAALAGGVSLAAGISIIVLLLIFLRPGLRPLPETQTPLPVDGLPPRARDCAVATDGVLREIEGGIYLWRIESQTVAPPILLSRKGVQPRAAWIGDRYAVVWVAPDAVSPVIEMLEVGRDGRPMQLSATVVAQTAQGRKVGFPGVTGGRGRVLTTYFVQGGALMARTFAGQTQTEAVQIHVGKGMHHSPMQLLTTADGFLVCWDVNSPEGAEIRLAILDEFGGLRAAKSLARARTPITSFDLKIPADGRLTLLWSEVQPGGALTFKQMFSPEGDPLEPPRNLFVADHKPSAVVFGDAEGKTWLWPPD